MPTELNMVITVKMTTTIIKQFVKIYLILDVAVILACIIANNYLWLLNTQVAFISAMLITLGSFWGYKKNIQNRLKGVEASNNALDEQDAIDKIDDPFDLYSEINEEKEQYTASEIKEIITQEKKKIKQHSIKNAIFSASGFASVYRILGYMVLIFGFFALNNNGLLHVFSYVAGLLTVTLATLAINLSSKSVADQS